MARPLRIERPGAWYHLTARGNERQAIYRDQRDYQHFCELLANAVAQFRWRLHAYVLMKNHFHLMVETIEPNLSASMQWLGVSYTVWFNRRHERSGHLFQGRFKSLIVEPAAWSVALSHYIHLNPVRVSSLALAKTDRAAAAMPGMGAPDPELVRKRLERLDEFPWSSYRAYIGIADRPHWLSCDHILDRMGKGSLTARQRRYCTEAENMVRHGLPPSPWEQLQAAMALGSQKFLRKIRATIAGNQREQPAVRHLAARPNWDAAVAAVERVKRQRWAAFRDRHADYGRDLVLYLARKHCGLKLGEIGVRAGGLDYVSVAMAVRRLSARLTRNKRLAAQAAEATRQLYNVKM
ncbi:MAG TPA: transposase [Verrucomicrobiae bacterium]|nr:transposase [Verrucomicrobiae bacterium]